MPHSTAVRQPSQATYAGVTPKPVEVLRALSNSQAAAAAVNEALSNAAYGAASGASLPLPLYQKLVLSSQSKKICNDYMHTSHEALTKGVAKVAVGVAEALLATVEKESFGTGRGSMDGSPQGYLQLLLTHSDFGVPSSTSCLPSRLRGWLAEGLLKGLGSRVGGRKNEEYAKVRDTLP